MQTTLAQFNETQSQDAFALQNSKLLKVSLQQVTIQARTCGTHSTLATNLAGVRSPVGSMRGRPQQASTP